MRVTMLDCDFAASMSIGLSQLAQLQAIETEIAHLSKQLAEYPKKIAARQQALQETRKRIEGNAQAMEAEAATRRRMESDIDDLRQKQTRYQAQLDTVQSDSQAKALEHQIVFCKSEIDRLEEVEIHSLMQTETLEETRRALDETAANQQLALEKEQAAAQLAESRDQAQLADLQQQHKEMRATIDESLLATYDRITAGKKFAVARVEGHQCSACQMVVRPQKFNEIRDGAIHFCESCGRFLYYDPPVDFSNVIELPAAKKPSGAAWPAEDDSTSRSAGPHPEK